MAAELKEPPWDVGDEIVIFIELVDAAELPANPNECVLQIGDRKGEVLHTFKKSLGELDNPVAGTWQKTYVIEDVGLQFTWDATGVVTVVAQGQIPTQTRKLPRPA